MRIEGFGKEVCIMTLGFVFHLDDLLTPVVVICVAVKGEGW
jgi:hypothetical protein